MATNTNISMNAFKNALHTSRSNAWISVCPVRIRDRQARATYCREASASRKLVVCTTCVISGYGCIAFITVVGTYISCGPLAQVSRMIQRGRHTWFCNTQKISNPLPGTVTDEDTFRCIASIEARQTLKSTGCADGVGIYVGSI